jgi:hypothetical protein
MILHFIKMCVQVALILWSSYILKVYGMVVAFHRRKLDESVDSRQDGIYVE